MASEPEGPAANTIISETNEQASPDEITQADEQWPVSDLYYIDSDEAAAADTASDDSASATVVTTSVDGAVRRRFPPDVGVGGILAAVAAAVALVFGGALLGLNDDEPTATAQGPTSPTSTTSPAESTPASAVALPATAKVELADVEGMSLAEARDQLERQGLKVRVTRSASERPRGEVLGQAPAAGSRVDEDTVVALTASRGTGSGEQPAEGVVEVPGVVGLSASEIASLRAADVETIPMCRMTRENDE